MWYYFEWLNCKQRTRINVSNKNISERNHKAVRVLITESKYTKIYLLICYLLLWPLRHQSRSMFSGDCGRRMWSSVCRSTWRSQPAWVLRDAPSYRTPGGIARREAVGWRYNFLFLFFYFATRNLFTMCIYWKNNYRHEKYVTRKPKRNHWAYMNWASSTKNEFIPRFI